MPQSTTEWHDRFSQQADWTGHIRGYLLGQLDLPLFSRILEVGCGTGAVTAALNAETPANVFGLDLNLAFLRFASEYDLESSFCGGNAFALPFADSTFAAVVCHYFLLWITEPAAALSEMIRVTRPGGSVLALAEPDYGGRIDHPPPLDELGGLQTKALRRQGAEPQRGRELSGLFHAAGLEAVQTGLLGGQWQGAPDWDAIKAEWTMLKDDLEGSISDKRLEEMKQADHAAWQSGSRVLFVPTFFAAGKKRQDAP